MRIEVGMYVSAEEAVQWAAVTGFAVFPARAVEDPETGKVSKPPKTGCVWNQDSSRDPEKIRELWGDEQWIIGVDCGKSGIFVVDIDTPEHMTDEWREVLIEAQNRTRTLPSLSKGLPHIYCLQPEGEMRVLTSKVPFGDIRGMGSYVVVRHGAAPLRDHPVVGAPSKLLSLCSMGEVSSAVSSSPSGSGVRSDEVVSTLVDMSVTQSLVVSEKVSQSFLDRSVDTFFKKCMTDSRRMTALSTSMSMFIEAAAGLYPFIDAYEVLRKAYRLERMGGKGEKPGDWTLARQRDFDLMWAGLIEAWSTGGQIRIGTTMSTIEDAVAEKLSEVEIHPESDYDEGDYDEEIAEIVNMWMRTDPHFADEAESDDDDDNDNVAEVIQMVASTISAPAPNHPSTFENFPPEDPEEIMRMVAAELWPDKDKREIFKILEQAKRSDVFQNALKLQRAIQRRSEQIEVLPASELDWDVEPIEAPTSLLRTDGVGLMHTGGLVHLFFGDASAGKSWIAMLLIVEALHRGERVVWIDYEMGWRAVVPKLAALGLKKADTTGLLYIDAKSDGVPLRHYSESLDDWGPQWIVVDSISRAIAADSALAEAGGENSNQGFIDWLREELLPHVEGETSILLIDHPGNGDKERTRGASAKRQQVDIEYQVTNVAPFSATSSGHSEILCRKDRSGFYANGESVGFLQVTPTNPAGSRFSIIPPTGGAGRTTPSSGVTGLAIAQLAEADIARRQVAEARLAAKRNTWKRQLVEHIRRQNISEFTFSNTRAVKGLSAVEREVAFQEMVNDGAVFSLGGVGYRGVEAFRLADR